MHVTTVLVCLWAPEAMPGAVGGRSGRRGLGCRALSVLLQGRKECRTSRQEDLSREKNVTHGLGHVPRGLSQGSPRVGQGRGHAATCHSMMKASKSNSAPRLLGSRDQEQGVLIGHVGT